MPTYHSNQAAAPPPPHPHPPYLHSAFSYMFNHPSAVHPRMAHLTTPSSRRTREMSTSSTGSSCASSSKLWPVCDIRSITCLSLPLSLQSKLRVHLWRRIASFFRCLNRSRWHERGLRHRWIDRWHWMSCPSLEVRRSNESILMTMTTINWRRVPRRSHP